MKNKYGLVLEGGGAKGSYHIGAYLALKELGYNFKAVVGTSIGAINGAFIASGEIDKCKFFWKNKSFVESFSSDSFTMPTITDDMDMLTKLKELGKIMFNGTLPLEPMQNLVYEGLSEDKIRNSNIKFGLVTVNVTDKKGEELFAEDIKQGELLDYIIASSYLPVFKMQPLNGKYFLDGGFYNNIPFNMVQKLKLTPIIVRVNPKDYHDKSFPKNAIVIEPKNKLNSSLNFDPKLASEIINIGYYDTIRTVKKLLGNMYYFENCTEKHALKIFSDKLFDYFKDHYNDYKCKSPYRILYEEYFPKIASELNIDSNYTTTDILIALAERKLDRIGYDRFNIYNLIDVAKEMKLDDFFTENFNKSLLQRLITT